MSICCIWADNINYCCTNKNVKRSFFGLGARLCIKRFRPGSECKYCEQIPRPKIPTPPPPTKEARKEDCIKKFEDRQAIDLEKAIISAIAKHTIHTEDTVQKVFDSTKSFDMTIVVLDLSSSILNIDPIHIAEDVKRAIKGDDKND